MIRIGRSYNATFTVRRHDLATGFVNQDRDAVEIVAHYQFYNNQDATHPTIAVKRSQPDRLFVLTPQANRLAQWIGWPLLLNVAPRNGPLTPTRRFLTAAGRPPAVVRLEGGPARFSASYAFFRPSYLAYLDEPIDFTGIADGIDYFPTHQGTFIRLPQRGDTYIDPDPTNDATAGSDWSRGLYIIWGVAVMQHSGRVDTGYSGIVQPTLSADDMAHYDAIRRFDVSTETFSTTVHAEEHAVSVPPVTYRERIDEFAVRTREPIFAGLFNDVINVSLPHDNPLTDYINDLFDTTMEIEGHTWRVTGSRSLADRVVVSARNDIDLAERDIPLPLVR